MGLSQEPSTHDSRKPNSDPSWGDAPRGAPQAHGDPQTRFAEKLGIPVQRVNEIINGKRGVTPETAWLFADALGTTPQFWMNLQANYDLARTRPEKHIKRIQAAG